MVFSYIMSPWFLNFLNFDFLSGFTKFNSHFPLISPYRNNVVIYCNIPGHRPGPSGALTAGALAAYSTNTAAMTYQ